MNSLIVLRKRTLYFIGFLIALVASYVVASDSYSITIDSPQVLPSKVYADIPGGGGGGGDDCGDSGDGSCQ